MSIKAGSTLISVEEAAGEIGVTTGRIRQLLREGVLLGEKLNARAWAVFRESAREFAKTEQLVGRPRVGEKKTSKSA